MRALQGYISDYARSLNPYEVYARLNPIKKLLLKILGVVKLETLYVKTPVGTEGTASIYLVKCPRCGQLYIDYPHGYTKYLECPKCETRIHLHVTRNERKH